MDYIKSMPFMWLCESYSLRHHVVYQAIKEADCWIEKTDNNGKEELKQKSENYREQKPRDRKRTKLIKEKLKDYHVYSGLTFTLDKDRTTKPVRSGYTSDALFNKAIKNWKSERPPWSAAFISYLFGYAGGTFDVGWVRKKVWRHKIYINQARINSDNADKDKYLWLYPTNREPRVGDLLCFNRKVKKVGSKYKNRNYYSTNGQTNIHSPNGESHADLIVDIIKLKHKEYDGNVEITNDFKIKRTFPNKILNDVEHYYVVTIGGNVGSYSQGETCGRKYFLFTKQTGGNTYSIAPVKNQNNLGNFSTNITTHVRYFRPNYYFKPKLTNPLHDKNNIADDKDVFRIQESSAADLFAIISSPYLDGIF